MTGKKIPADGPRATAPAACAFLLAFIGLAFIGLNGCNGESQGPARRPAARAAPRASVAALNQALAAVRDGEASDVPDAHTIRGVPTRRQVNENTCVLACVEMLFGYWNLDRGNQLHLARAYARANPTSPGRKAIASLTDGQLPTANWDGLETNYNGLINYLNKALGDKGKCYYWSYAGEGGPDRHLLALKTLISRDVPVLASIKGAGIDIGHSVLVTGYGPRHVGLIDPITGRRVRQGLDQFMEAFQRINCEWVTFVPE